MSKPVVTLQFMFDDFASGELGEEINLNASGVNGDIHCWNGQRYRLTLERLPDGCKYDPNTGKTLPLMMDDISPIEFCNR